MDKYKEKYLTPLQRTKHKLKLELKKEPTIITKLRVMWYRRQLELIRLKQFTRGGDQ